MNVTLVLLKGKITFITLDATVHQWYDLLVLHSCLEVVVCVVNCFFSICYDCGNVFMGLNEAL